MEVPSKDQFKHVVEYFQLLEWCKSAALRDRSGKIYLHIEAITHAIPYNHVVGEVKSIVPKALCTSSGGGEYTFRLNPEWNPPRKNAKPTIILGNPHSEFVRETNTGRVYREKVRRYYSNTSPDDYCERSNPKYPIIGGPCDGQFATAKDTVPNGYRIYNRYGASGPKQIYLWLPDEKLEQWKFCS